MTVDSMARLAAANPVAEPPAVEPAERLRRLIEDDAASIELGPRRERRSPIRRRTLMFAPLAVCASVAGVLLSAGSSGPRLNVAAAAYAATAPQPGIVEAVFVARIFRGPQAGGTLRQRQWNDSATGLRREQNTVTGPYGDTGETHTLEMAFAPGRWETWGSGPEANVITRMRTHAWDLKLSMGFGGISVDGVEGITLYRKLYREGLMRLVGHERHNGRLLWKLESPARSYADANGTKIAVRTLARLVVLVDPKTFLPVSERQLDAAFPGHPTVVESNLVSYRHFSGGESEGRLFDLAAQHPGARVITRSMSSRFHSSHEHRHAPKQ